MSALVALGFGAGLLAPVNPCGFALLPAYLTTSMQDAATGSAAVRLRRTFGAGAAVTLGFSATLTAVGVALAAGLRAITGLVPWLALAVGMILTLVGVAMTLGLGVRLRLPTFGSGSRRTAGGRRWGRRAFALAGVLVVLAMTTAQLSPIPVEQRGASAVA